MITLVYINNSPIIYALQIVFQIIEINLRGFCWECRKV